LYGGAGKRALCASEELAQNGRPAPLWFCGAPLLYGGAGKRALCASSEELAQNGRPAPLMILQSSSLVWRRGKARPLRLTVAPCGGKLRGLENVLLLKTVLIFARRIGVTASLVAASAWALGAQTYTTLFTFPCSGVDGAGPDASLIQDTDGNLYGSTYLGGNASGGTIYKITPGGTFTTAYDICLADGQCPVDIGPSAPLTEAADGRLYGTTLGTAEIESNPGAIFVAAGGKLHLLHFFCSESGCADGFNPGAMIQASDGAF
jgi:uncharacterized repeat protein (TIGR03803 family)